MDEFCGSYTLLGCCFPAISHTVTEHCDSTCLPFLPLFIHYLGNSSSFCYCMRKSHLLLQLHYLLSLHVKMWGWVPIQSKSNFFLCFLKPILPHRFRGSILPAMLFLGNTRSLCIPADSSGHTNPTVVPHSLRNSSLTQLLSGIFFFWGLFQ